LFPSPTLFRSEQHLRLLVDGAFAGVEVFGLDRVVVEQASRTEPDDVPTAVLDRPHEPAVEPVDRTAPALLGQLCPVELGQLETAAQQVFRGSVPSRRGVPATELRPRALVEPPFGEERARGLGLRSGELFGVERLGGLVRLDQSQAGTTVPADATAASLVGQLQSDAVGEPFDGFDEAEVLDLHDELDDVAAFTAAEAMEGAVRGPHVERGCLLLVERAQALQSPATGAS